MATLAEMFISNILQQNAQPLSKSNAGWETGAQLAKLQQDRQQQAAQLEQKKQELELAKYEKVAGWYESLSKMANSPAKQAFAKDFIPTGVQALGLNDRIHPTVLDMFEKDAKLATGATSLIRQGKLSVTDLNKPEKIAAIYPEASREGAAEMLQTQYGKELGEAEEQALDRQSAEAQAKLRNEAGKGRGEQIQGRFEQSQKAKLADKLTALGIPGLNTAVKSLDSNIPGGLDGWKPGQHIPGISGAEGAIPTNRLRGVANKIRGDALSVGNQVIKLRTGAAMSDGEAQRILSEIGFVPTIGEGGTWTGLTFKGIVSDESFVNGMRRAKSALQAQEDVFKNAYGADVYESVMKPTAKAAGGERMFKMSDGKERSESRLRAFREANPNSPLTPEINKLLGEK